MKEFYFKCIVCEHEFEKKDVEYTCPLCGENLEVMYEYKKIKKNFSKKNLSKNNNKTIWRYIDLLPVEDNNVLTKIQLYNSPLIRSINVSQIVGIKNLFFKDDTKLASGSLKDRASAIVVAYGLQNNKEKIVTASTGNAGCALACISAMVGIRPEIYVPHTAPLNKLIQMTVYGAKIYKVEGSYDDCYDKVLNLCLEDKKYFNRSTGINPFTREGKKTVSLEIWEQMSYTVPDIIFVSIGDGNIISGVWKGFKDLYELGLIEKLPILIGVQSKLSNAIFLTLKKIEQKFYSNKNKKYSKSIKEILQNTKIQKVEAKTVADSISVNFPRDAYAALKSIIESGGYVIEVDDTKIINSIKTLASKEGLFCEPAAATSFAGMMEVVKYSDEIKNKTVVVLITGHGLKDVKTIMASYKNLSS